MRYAIGLLVILAASLSFAAESAPQMQLGILYTEVPTQLVEIATSEITTEIPQVKAECSEADKRACNDTCDAVAAEKGQIQVGDAGCSAEVTTIFMGCAPICAFSRFVQTTCTCHLAPPPGLVKGLPRPMRAVPARAIHGR